MSVLLVTGTDTGVGKTLVTTMVAAALCERGVRVGVAKPVETGCPTVDGTLYPEDAVALRGAANDPTPLDAVCPQRFADPLAPVLAARRAGAAIDVAALVAALRARAATADVLLVEGAGGLLVPLTPHATYADLAQSLAARVLVVVGSRLGAINAALLTLEALERRALPIAGYVMSRLASDADPAVATNSALLRELTSVACVGDVPHLPEAGALAAAVRKDGAESDAARGRLARLARAHLDVEAIVGPSLRRT